MALEEARNLFEAKDFEGAIRELSSVLKQDKGHAEALYHRAMSYRMLQQHEQSLKDFDVLLEISPDNSGVLSERGVTKYHLNDLSGSLEDMDAAQALDPQNPFRYSSRAYIRAAAKDIEGAIADYEEAIRLDPKDAVAMNNLGLLEEQRGRKDTAKKYYSTSDKLLGVPSEKERETKFKASQIALDEESHDKEKSNDSLSKSFIRTVRALVTDKEERKSFVDFLKKGFKL